MLDIVVTGNEFTRMRIHIVPPLPYVYIIAIGNHIVIRQVTAIDYQGWFFTYVKSSLAFLLIKTNLQYGICINIRFYRDFGVCKTFTVNLTNDILIVDMDDETLRQPQVNLL